ncbi:MAG: hypothetical protein ACJ798_04295 [Phenylobacterium sp.]
MANENRSFDPTPQQANRSVEQGLGVGQKEMDAQRDPNRDQHATDLRRTARLETDQGISGAGAIENRDAADTEGEEALGDGTPANVDIHKLGQEDNPEEDWGEAADEGTMHSSNHTRRPVKTEADRGQGAKTRQLNKDIVSRRN